MPTGTVKWFDPNKGFGFIVPDEGDRDLFVQAASLELAGIAMLAEGQKVQFDVLSSRDGKVSAQNLKVAG